MGQNPLCLKVSWRFWEGLADETNAKSKSIGCVSFLTRLILVNHGLARLSKQYMLFGQGDVGR
jgi:hypothetical protein